MFEELLEKGSIKMVDMYYRLVKAGLRSIENVPDQYRDAVLEDLTASVLRENENLTPTQTQTVSNILVNI